MKAVPASRVVAFLSVTMAAVAWDLFSKWWVFQHYGYPYRGSGVLVQTPFLWGTFDFEFFTLFNQGTLWGLGQGKTWVFVLLSFGAIVFICYAMFVNGGVKRLSLSLPLAFILGGVLGNLFDRLYLHGCTDADGQALYGVRDFLHCHIPMLRWRPPFSFELDPYYDYPVFNFADVYLVLGAVWLTGYAFFVKDPVPDPAPEPKLVADPGTPVASA